MWVRPQGYSEIISPVEDIVSLDKIRKEHIPPGVAKFDTATCYHCGSVFHISARMHPSDIGGVCKQCMQIICPRCLDKPCVPWEKQMELLEGAIERRRAREGWGG